MIDDAVTPGPTSPVKGLSHFQLTVSDVAASESWYTQVIGLERLAAEDGAYVALRHRPSNVVVVLSAGPTEGPDARDTRLDHIAFYVADGESLRDWAAQLSGLGIHHAGVVDEDGRPSLMLNDPDGTRIELVAPS